jgi:hypothetical protein
MNNELTINTGLTIDLLSPKVLTRSTNFNRPSRKRLTCEKYFRQAIYIFNSDGKYIDSGFIQINDYTNMCKMIKVCNKSKKYFHLYEKWEHFGKKIYKTDNFSITDLVSGNTIGTIGSRYVSDFTCGNKACFVGDLEKDDYSEMLLECLNEYSSVNAPPKPFAFLENLGDKTCGCNLFEELEIDELLKNDEINEEQKQKLSNKLNCGCKNIPLKPELTEEQKINRAELKLQAQSEIALVFLRMKLASEVEETEL